MNMRWIDSFTNHNSIFVCCVKTEHMLLFHATYKNRIIWLCFASLWCHSFLMKQTKLLSYFELASRPSLRHKEINLIALIMQFITNIPVKHYTLHHHHHHTNGWLTNISFTESFKRNECSSMLERPSTGRFWFKSRHSYADSGGIRCRELSPYIFYPFCSDKYTCFMIVYSCLLYLIILFFAVCLVWFC